MFYVLWIIYLSFILRPKQMTLQVKLKQGLNTHSSLIHEKESPLLCESTPLETLIQTRVTKRIPATYV